MMEKFVEFRMSVADIIDINDPMFLKAMLNTKLKERGFELDRPVEQFDDLERFEIVWRQHRRLWLVNLLCHD